jgi:HK97 gp10 family phage protein
LDDPKECVMPDSIKFSLQGLDSLLKKFDAVAYDVKRKGGRSALRKAAQLVMEAAKENAQALDDSGTGRSIAENIALRWNGRLFKHTGDLGFRVGVLHGAILQKNGSKEVGAPTPHWRLFEFGTSKMRPRPFMRRALSENIIKATDVFAANYEKSLDRAIKKAGK